MEMLSKWLYSLCAQDVLQHSNKQQGQQVLCTSLRYTLSIFSASQIILWPVTDIAKPAASFFSIIAEKEKQPWDL